MTVFKAKTCIQIEHSRIKLIFITYLPAYSLILLSAKVQATVRKNESGSKCGFMLYVFLHYLPDYPSFYDRKW